MGSDIEFSIPGKVSHPRKSVIPTFLLDLKISHIDTRKSVVGNFKLDIDRSLFVFLIVSYDYQRFSYHF